MLVDPQTKLFVELTPEEKAELLLVVRALIIDGKIEGRINDYYQLWADVSGIDPFRNRILVMATIFAQYALLSLLEE